MIIAITPQVAMLIGVVVLRKRSSRFPSHQVNTFFTKTKTKTQRQGQSPGEYNLDKDKDSHQVIAFSTKTKTKTITR